MKGCALGLALIEKLKAIRKWPTETGGKYRTMAMNC